MACIWTLSKQQLSVSRLQSCLTASQVRFRKRAPAKMYREPYYDEKLLRASVEPVFRKNTKVPTWESCSNLQIQPSELHPYEKILSREFKNDLASNRVMAIFQMNPIASKDYDRSRRTFLKNNFLLRRYSENVARATFENSKYTTLIPFLVQETVFVFSQEPRVTELLDVSKPMPQFLLLGGVLDGYLLSRDELVEYNNFPSKEVLLAQVCHTLTQVSAATASALAYQLNSLSMTLSQYEKANADENKPEN